MTTTLIVRLRNPQLTTLGYSSQQFRRGAGILRLRERWVQVSPSPLTSLQDSCSNDARLGWRLANSAKAASHRHRPYASLAKLFNTMSLGPGEVVYSSGGTVQASGGTYIPRPADDELLRLCLDGVYAHVLTSRQMGKSSLRVAVTERLRAEGVRTSAVVVGSYESSFRC